MLIGKAESIMKLFGFLIRLGLGGLLLWSGIAKARYPYDFLAAVYSYQLVGPGVGLVIAGVLPWLEMLLGSCLLAGFFTEGSMLLALTLMAAFTGAVASAWFRGLAITCGCFGDHAGTIDGSTVIRSIALLLLTLLGLMLIWRQPRFQRKNATFDIVTTS